MSRFIWSTSFAPYGGGQKAGVGGLSDAGLLDRLNRYKRQVAKRYRVLDSGQIERALPKGQLWISPKLDGELWFLVRRGGEVALCAYNGRVLLGLPQLTVLAARLASAGDLLVAGELLAPIAEGRPRSHHLATALGDERHAAALAFHAFDLVEDHGQEVMDQPYARRLARLQELFGEAGIVTTVTGETAAVAGYYREWVAAGKHEGVVVRTEQNLTFKIKPHLTLDAVVVAYGERLVGDTRQLRELSVALVRDDGSLQLLGTVGGGFSDEDRLAWHRRLGPLAAPSSFRMANSEGTLSRFVRPELVVEVRCSDLLVSDSDDLPVRRMALMWDAERGYTPLGERVTAVMLHPAFLRERSDKKPEAVDCGLSQLTSRVELTEESLTAAGPTEAASVVKREVWTKEVKGQVAVRKYVLIQTHKPGRDWPPLVLHCADYSPGRAEPLQITLRTADTLATAEIQIAAWIEENIKKGWNPAGANATSPSPTETAEPKADEAPPAKKRAAKTPKS